MKRLWTGVSAAVLSAALLWSGSAQAQQALPAAAAPGQDATGQQAPLPWPRDFALAGDQLLQLYQPQVDSWTGDVMSGRAAVAIGPKSGTPTYGMVRFSTRVAVDKPAGLVHLATISIEGVEVPTEPAKASLIRSTLQSRLPASGMTVPLDQLQASYAVNQELAKLKSQPVDNTPPQILFATTTTVLVPVAGTPVLRPIAGAPTFQRVVNTRPLMLLDEAGTYHLEAGGHWYESPSLTGTWILTPQISDALSAAAKAALQDQAADPLLDAKGKPINPAPAILVATQPAELIQSNGPPQMLPVAGTNLLSMNNADHAVFMETTSNSYYILLSGRWFRAPDLKGPWTFVASNALPKDFAKISPNDPKANVLVSVAGTPQAKEAVIAATIPQTATVKRDVPLKVAFDGTPRFEPIPGTGLNYAINTATPVIQLDTERYYAVNNGIWFVAETATGPWHVADVVPDAIYTIPVSSPLHYVTYVRIYATTPEAVVVGYTPGYMGVVVAPGGTVVYGTGYTCPGYVGAYWYSCPVTYGLGAGFALGVADGFAFGFAAGWPWGAAVTPYWGPYWGVGYGPYAGPWGGHWGYTNINQANLYGRWGGAATVNHAWGTTWNGTEWSGRDWHGTTAGGTGFTGRSAAGFNPYTGNYAAGAENARYNPTTGARGESRAGVEGNAYTGNAAAGRESAGFNPTTGTGHASQTAVTDTNGKVSVDSRGVAGNVKTGNAVAWNNGHVAVDHDGNVYQHTDTGWAKNTGSGWQNVDRAADTSRLDAEENARSVSQQRVSSYDGGGGEHFGGGYGGGYGGDHYGSGGFDRSFGGFGGGDRFGGGGFRGGGFGGGFRR
ncbi:carbohydrate-binding family V/XII [Xanthobacter autotrophicus]|uniref:carbohydrate-binding family V/XII n=1 Tax=Xanthobacter autotrophicus TaxID=280 RepID=UPI00372B31BB